MHLSILCPKCNDRDLESQTYELKTIISCPRCGYKITVSGLFSQKFNEAKTDKEREELISYFRNLRNK